MRLTHPCIKSRWEQLPRSYRPRARQRPRPRDCHLSSFSGRSKADFLFVQSLLARGRCCALSLSECALGGLVSPSMKWMTACKSLLEVVCNFLRAGKMSSCVILLPASTWPFNQATQAGRSLHNLGQIVRETCSNANYSRQRWLQDCHGTVMTLSFVASS